MDDDPRGLVHDEEVLVGVGDRELGRRRSRLGGDLCGRVDLDLLPTREPVALAQRSPVDEHGARSEQPLGRGPGGDFRQRGEVAVEPLARSLRRDDVPLQRLDAGPLSRRGARSANASAATRIATPITMKLSARLNAGQ
jgi:hypothetical protein